MEKNEQVTSWLTDLPQELQVVASEIRDLIFQTAPELEEQFKWKMPNYALNGQLVMYLQSGKNHLNVGFQQGFQLASLDVQHQLQGTGPQMRHLVVEPGQTMPTTLIQQFITEKVAP